MKQEYEPVYGQGHNTESIISLLFFHFEDNA